MTLYLESANCFIIMTRKSDERFKEKYVCHFCGIEIFLKKVRDHCRLTVKYRGSAHNKCNNTVAQKQNDFFPFLFHKFLNFECHLFLKISVDMKENELNLIIVLRQLENTYQQHILVLALLVVISSYQPVQVHNSNTCCY